MQKSISFKPHKAMRITLIVLWVFLTAVFIGIAYGFSSKVMIGEDQTVFNYFNIFMATIVILFGAFIWVYNSKKITVDEKQITYKSILKEKIIALKDLKGYRKHNEIPTFYAIKKSRNRKIRAFANNKLTTWVDANFVNLDHEDYIEEEDQILADSSFGATPLEREEKLVKARNYANSLTVGCGIFMFVSILFQLTPTIFFYVGLICLALISYGFIVYKGLMRLELKTARASIWPSAVLTIIFLGFGWMGIGNHSDFSIIIYVVIMALVMTIFYVFVLVGSSNYQFKFIWMPLLIFFGITITGTMALNVVLDFSTPKTYSTRIAEIVKETSGRGYVTYKMKLNSWRSEVDHAEVRVTRDTYLNTPKGAQIEIEEHDGLFGKTWYTVSKNGYELNNSDVGVNLGGDIKRLFD